VISHSFNNDRVRDDGPGQDTLAVTYVCYLGVTRMFIVERVLIKFLNNFCVKSLISSRINFYLAFNPVRIGLLYRHG
jgi:hypothetical protein